MGTRTSEGNHKNLRLYCFTELRITIQVDAERKMKFPFRDFMIFCDAENAREKNKAGCFE